MSGTHHGWNKWQIGQIGWGHIRWKPHLPASLLASPNNQSLELHSPDQTSANPPAPPAPSPHTARPIPKHNARMEPFYRWVVRQFIFGIYRPRITGLEHVPETGAVLLIANHLSYLDGLIISAIIKRPVRYVIYREIYNLPIINYFMRCNRAIPIFPKREDVEMALEAVSEGMKQGDCICIFPEGQITYTGYLGRFRPGVEYMFERDPHITLVPIGIDGLWGSIFSRKYIKSSLPWLPRIWGLRVNIAIGWPVPAEKVKVDKLQRVVLKLMERARALR